MNNFPLNPAHPDFSQLHIGKPLTFRLPSNRESKK